VIALGGNAILRPGQRGTLAEQQANIAAASVQIARVIALGYRVVLTHGNGPQVGNILIQNEEARLVVPPMPLDVCGAQSGGMIGYLFQQELQRQTGRPAVSLVTQVVVDPADPAFTDPSKPVGPFYTPAKAQQMVVSHGWIMKEDAGRGWRRVVPSPLPVRVVELQAIKHLVFGGLLVIACGGGGVPVVETQDGLVGVEAVIDKDLAAQKLAMEMQAELLIILTDVPRVYINYGLPTQRALDWVSMEEGLQYLSEGHFPAGSMKSKVEGVLRFVQAGGERAVIAALGDAEAAVLGTAGTQFVKQRDDLDAV
jgi:carbamate kinase